MNKKWLHLVFSLLLITTLQFTSCVQVFAESDSSITTDYEWKDGPATVSLDDKATLKVAEDLMFLDADNTKKFMEDSESFPNGSEIGSLYGAGEQSNWYVIFEYNHTGHIDDSDKNDLDADELLESYKRGTEEQNKKTSAENQLNIVGWDIEPAYDNSKHQLRYSLALEDAQQEALVNYNVNVLTREGYIGVILVTDSANFEQNRKQFEEHVLNNLTVNSGYTYGEFDASLDKKSELGLTGLILGGAGVAVAKKVGLLLLLKKGWIFIVAALAGAFGWLRRKLTGRKNTLAASSTESPEAPTLSPAEEAYRQHAAGQESLSSAADDDPNKRSS
ncbi:DUF2167 domain-containing protein [Paenibacillus silvae]|uniref:DUF2167 domain-containing protein n=1 Tax=Paenibacillus silvae TaxID=1325358 RepID=UPI0011A5DC08|nr:MULTISPECIES: DUF2167 domain-containing protein [Paenibacillus]MCK6076292.1 DUF2167 domain-containing protein [Paenibacillus silvae]MCK6078353.1 DUF2167 domain-containing protein [Paenibacillus silvae]MCK6150549.1 DUF2167 domain-containing protein [Paenibacillus silvae]MCK6268809.1 DUF2167 domain-containing protein [Paenibacillus silvae]MCK6270402.1 DUF2167 domain-containing protein [Paenibacillus silvae]